MDIGNAIRRANEQITEKDLVSITLLDDENSRIAYEQKTHRENVPTYKQIRSILTEYGMEEDVSHFYLCDAIIEGLCYWNAPYYMSFPLSLFTDEKKNNEEGMFGFFIERFKEKKKYLLDCLLEGDYSSILLSTDTPAVAMVMNHVYWQLPKEQRYELFCHVYTEMERGHTLIDKDILLDAVSHRSQEETDSMLEALKKYTKNGFLKVYRGEGTASTSYKEAYSWTLRFETACFFAVRHSKTGKVYEANVKAEDVLAFLENRNEREVLIQPNHLHNVRDVGQADVSDEMSVLKEEGYFEEFHLYKNTFIKEEYYHNPYGVHGIPHVQRTLIHCLNLARIHNLDDKERGMLAMAACYHDIGRTHDRADDTHGRKSWKKYTSSVERQHPLVGVTVVKLIREYGDVEAGEYELERIKGEDREIVRFIIENHCVNDKKAKRKLEHDNRIQRKEEAWRLYALFKDADGLERVRLHTQLGDIDVSYLRNRASKDRLLFAKRLFDQMRNGL